MSEKEKYKKFFNTQQNTKKAFPKLFVKLKKMQNPDNNSKFQNFLIKSRNPAQIKRINCTPFSFNKNNITKSTFYSKLESNSSTKYDNNKHTLTEMNQTYPNKLKNKTESILLSSLYNVSNDKRKTINYFKRPKNNSLKINNKNRNKNMTVKYNDIQNISSIIYPKANEEKNNSIIITNPNFDSQISNIKANSTNYNISFNNISKNKSKIKNKKDKYSNLEFFLKNKFYSDIQDKFNKQFKGKRFTHDNSVKDKLIQIHQVCDFFGGFLDYTNPILSTKRFQYVTKLIDDRKRNTEITKKYEETNKYYSFSEKNKKSKKFPKLYTIPTFIQKRKKELKEENNIEKIRKNKTEEQIKFFLNNLYE